MSMWSIRSAITVFAVMLFASSLGSGVVSLLFDTVPDRTMMSEPGVLIGMVVATGFGFAAGLAYAVRRIGWAPFPFRRLSPHDVAWSVAMVVPALGVGYGFTALMSGLGVHSEPQLVVEGLLTTPSSVALSVGMLYAIFGAAFAEELLFRGVLQPPFVARFGPAKGIAVTAILFGLIHLADPWALVPVTVIGAIAGWLRHRTNGLASPILFHALNNAIAIGLTVWGS